MHSLKLKNLQFQKKSKRKAGEGKKSGLYKFFTSSIIQKSFVDEADFVGPALILGTGGSASIHYCDTEFSTSTDCFILKTDSLEIDLKYVYYYLVGNIDILEQGFKGAGLRHISKEYLCNLEIPLPPLPQQKHIIEKLDTLTELIALRKTSIQKTEELTKSVFIEMFGDPMINEKGWEVKPLGSYGLLQRGKSQHRPRNAEFLFGGKYPFIQTGDVVNGEGCYIKKYKQTLSDEGIKQSREFKKGTICITIAANIGDAKILTFDSYFPDSVVGIKCDVPEFVSFLLSYYKKTLEQQATKTAQKNINLEVLNNLHVIFPPLSLQNKFAGIVEQNEETLRLQKESLKKLEELYAGAMQESFRV